jgi:hypothetical protein
VSEHAPIADHDAAALDRYFALTGERSTTGSTLERAKVFGEAAIADAEDKRARNNVLRRQLAAQGESLAALPWNLLELTARPMAETRPEPSYEPDYLSSALQAFVSRRLERMARAGEAESVLVLQVYFGSIGNNFAVGYTDEQSGRPVAPLPRVFSLLHVVPNGRKLLERAQPLLAPGLQSLSEYARMRSHASHRERGAYKHLREVFARAESEALQLYRAAGAAWNAATGGP